jgi:fatty acid elongase 3
MDAYFDRMSQLLESPITWGKYDWSQFLSPQNFKWTYGVTPFSNLQVVLFMGVFYLTSVVILQAYMKDRKAYSLKFFSQVHNVVLTLLSAAMFSGAAIGAYSKYESQGFFAGLLCEQEVDPMHGPLWYWSYIFYLSKYYEFIDTYLLILKKKPVIFLHAWHHLVMPYVGWAGLEGKWAMALWTSTFWNSFVHVFMYSYYFMSAFGREMWWKKYLTMLQIYQFVSGVGYTAAFFYYYFSNVQMLGNSLDSITFNQGCTGELWAILTMFFVNNSFLVLFVKFYVSTYKARSQRANKPPVKND